MGGCLSFLAVGVGAPMLLAGVVGSVWLVAERAPALLAFAGVGGGLMWLAVRYGPPPD